MKDIKEHIINLENQLLDKGCFVNVEIHEPASNSKISSAKKEFNLPEDLVVFYKEYNGLFIAWNSKRGIRCKGRLDIPSINTLKEYLSLEKEDTILTKYLNLGWIPLDIDTIFGYVTFIIQDENSYKLVRVDSNGNEFELNITIKEYLWLGVKVMGLYHWQNYISQNTFDITKQYSDDGFFYMINEKLGINVDEIFFKPQYSEFSKSIVLKNYTEELPTSLNIISHRKNSGCTPAEIRKIETSINQKLPQDFVSFLYSKYSLELHWEFEEAEGNYKMLNLGKIFGGTNYSESKVWENNYATYIGMDSSIGKKYSSFYPFIFEESGHTVFQIKDGEVQLYFIEDLEPYKINITFNQFIIKLHRCGGISGWQHLFTNQYSNDNPQIISLLNKMKECFSNIDLDRFVQE